MFWLALLVLGGGWLTRRFWWPLIVVPLFPSLGGGADQDQDSTLDLFAPSPLDSLLDPGSTDSATQGWDWDASWGDSSTLVDDPNPILVSVFDQEEDLDDSISEGSFLFTSSSIAPRSIDRPFGFSDYTIAARAAGLTPAVFNHPAISAFFSQLGRED